MMLNLILHWVMSALVLVLVATLLPGIHIANFGTALFATFVLGGVNILIRPVLALLTLPINILTLGLFSFVLNALMFVLAASLVPGFEVSNFWVAILGALLLAVFTGLLSSFTTNQRIPHSK